MTRGAVGTYFLYPTVLEDLNLLKELEVLYMHAFNIHTIHVCTHI